MKIICIIVFLLLEYTSFSQTQTINSIPKDGIVLNKGWKFHTGDNAEWSKTNLNDNEWKSITLSEYDYISQLKNNNTGWFRLSLLLDSSLLKSQLTIQLTQLGASEVYINGKLFKQFGIIKSSVNFKSFNPADKPFLLPTNVGRKVDIAIRFATYIPSKTWLYTGASTKRSPLTITINYWDNSLNTYKSSLEESGLPPVFYLFIVLALLFLLLFAFFPKEKINLLFGAFCFFQATSAVIDVQLSQGSFDISKFGLLSYIVDLNSIIVGTLMLLIIAQTVLNRITIYLLIVISGMGVDMLMFFFFGPVISQLTFDFICRISVMAAFFYLSVQAFRQRNYLIGIVSANSGIINIIGILIAYSTLNLNPLSLISVFMINFILITFYVSMNFARKSKNLEVQLVEIRNLSQDNLKKEQDKQQLLASQNETLEKQVGERTAALTKSLSEQQSTQAQLIQSEKMASLGELTAGIAHEIQNPLNFVNNFSEVNKEMLEELKAERLKPNADKTLEDEIINDVILNEEKINHHGKRADAIVKGMLQHSRQTKGVKEPTDINALCDEYLRLFFHGMRAKDKNFNATLHTDFDETLGLINIIPQDISRILLNLYNNAFYAINEKAKQQPNSYNPTISVTTKKIINSVELAVKDNGNGIPQNIIDKIFQPFFTTKPTGQGTGLGLSLAYDIITKEHNGTIKAESKEGEGSVFIIQLPINQ